MAINDAPVVSLVRGYYDDRRNVVVLPEGAPLARTAAFLSVDNFLR